MKVLFIQPNPIFGGAATATISVCKLLLERGADVIYSDEYDSNDKRLDVVVDHYPYHQNHFKSHAQIRNHILSLKPDVVCWSSNIIPYFIHDIRLLQKQGVAHISLLHSLALKKNLRGSLLDFLVAASLPYLNAIVFVSNYTLDSWNQYRSIKKAKCIKSVIYNAVSKPSELNNTNKPCKIGFVGRFSEEKQPELFCELSEMEELNSAFSFHAFGDGPLLESCRNRYHKVVYHGSVDDLDSIYQDIDVLLLTSKFENCPMVILESKARGIPCVAPNVGGIPEIVANGIDGLLYESYQQNSLCESLLKIVHNYGNYKEGCLTHRDKFFYESIGEKWNSLLSSL